MPRSRAPYPLEFRQQMVELVHGGRMPEELSREFEPSAQAIRDWVAQGDRDEGRLPDGLTSGEREELRRLSGHLWGAAYPCRVGRRGDRCGPRSRERSSVGDCHDNAMCESFFATLECELIDRHSFRARTEARTAVFEFIEGWYNPRRRNSSIGYLSPVNFERNQLSPRSPKSVTLHETGATPHT